MHRTCTFPSLRRVRRLTPKWQRPFQPWWLRCNGAQTQRTAGALGWMCPATSHRSRAVASLWAALYSYCMYVCNAIICITFIVIFHLHVFKVLLSGVANLCEYRMVDLRLAWLTVTPCPHTCTLTCSGSTHTQQHYRPYMQLPKYVPHKSTCMHVL